MSKWLTCNVEKGMFSDEFTVIVTTRDGEKYSFFVPKEEADIDHNRVRVWVNEIQGRSVAILPDAFRSTVEVKEQELFAA